MPRARTAVPGSTVTELASEPDATRIASVLAKAEEQETKERYASGTLGSSTIGSTGSFGREPRNTRAVAAKGWRRKASADVARWGAALKALLWRESLNVTRNPADVAGGSVGGMDGVQAVGCLVLALMGEGDSRRLKALHWILH